MGGNVGGETRFLGCLELQRGQVVLMEKERKYSRKNRYRERFKNQKQQRG